MAHAPQQGDRFRQRGTNLPHFVGSVIRKDGDGWIVRAADGHQWRLTAPDVVFRTEFHFVGDPMPDDRPRLVP